MTVLKEFKENVFNVLEGYLPLQEFEQWVYKSAELQELTSNDVVLEAFSFNYKQDDAMYQFKKVIFSYLDEDEFLLWKVKSNLRDLMENKENRDRILHDFSNLEYRYYFLGKIGNYIYDFESVAYYRNFDTVLIKLKEDAGFLLLEIEKQELQKPGFRLVDYQPINETTNEAPTINKKWWHFWK